MKSKRARGKYIPQWLIDFYAEAHPKFRNGVFAGWRACNEAHLGRLKKREQSPNVIPRKLGLFLTGQVDN